MSQTTLCSAHLPGFSRRRPIGPTSTPCTLPADHRGEHIGRAGERWPNVAVPVRSLNDPDLDFLMEFRALSRRLDALYASQAAGNDSVLLRDRARRLEALLSAMQGFPEAMAS
ncbi:hypothetical protein [Streptomyces sp. NPDC047070]|uniref:hypothetical protein n=1 Tax=Streptomyces sp. NPDC047070 TaxID=3154923 RepID=UPI003453EB03